MVLRRAIKTGEECDVHEWRRYLVWHRGEVRSVKRRTNKRERREGQRITDEINADPEEVASLRRSRDQARDGRRVRWLRDDETLDEVLDENSHRLP